MAAEEYIAKHLESGEGVQKEAPQRHEVTGDGIAADAGAELCDW